jgi:sortase A
LRNVGLIVVLFAVWQLWGTGIAESQSQNRLKAQYQLLVKADTNRASSVPAFAGGVAVKAGEGSPYLVSETKALSEAALPGGVLGRLRIPAIGVDDYFVEGVGEAQLQEGPGEYPGSGLPGQPGNLAIAGHRTTFGAPFFRLGDLSIGDRVIIDVPGGRATYRVSQPPFAVSPYDLNVLADYGDARLTLTTCNPPFFATTRLIVVAKLSQWLPTGTPIPSTDVAALVTPNVSLRAVQRLRANAPAAGVRRPNLTRASSGGLSEAANDASTVKGNLAAESNGWHFDTLPWAAGVVAALCALGGLYKRLSRFCMGASRWLVMVPLWAAGLLALFRVLGMLLPADL